MPRSSGSRCSVTLNKMSCLFRVMNKNIPLSLTEFSLSLLLMRLEKVTNFFSFSFFTGLNRIMIGDSYIYLDQG